MEPIRLFPSDYAGRGDTVQAVIDSYLTHKGLLSKAGLLAGEYLQRLHRHLEDFAGVYGTWPLSACRRSLLQDWVLSHQEWKESASRNDAVNSVIGCFRWGEDEGLIDRCPFKRPKNVWPPAEPRAPISAEQYLLIMDLARACNGKGRRKRSGRTHLRFILWFLWETGCRTCEARDLEWTHIDWEKGVAFMPKHKTKKRVGGVRTIPLSARVLRVLRFLLAHRREDRPHVFLNSRGRAWTRGNLGHRFRVYAKLAGVSDKVSAYSLRHGFVVGALERGVGDRQIADVIGQSSTRFIAWYGKGARSKTDYLRAVVAQARARNR